MLDEELRRRALTKRRGFGTSNLEICRQILLLLRPQEKESEAYSVVEQCPCDDWDRDRGVMRVLVAIPLHPIL